MSGDGPKPAAEVLIRGWEATRGGKRGFPSGNLMEFTVTILAGFIRLSFFLGDQTLAGGFFF